MKDRKGNNLYVGSLVVWFDPQAEHRDLTRKYHVQEINGEDEDAVILIADDYGEVEVFASELQVINLIPAPFDGKNLCDDSLLDNIFANAYHSADTKGYKLNNYYKYNIYCSVCVGDLDCYVNAKWSAKENVLRIELVACPCVEDFSYMRECFFNYYEGIFKSWECEENRDLRVTFKREENVLYVSFWFEDEIVNEC